MGSHEPQVREVFEAVTDLVQRVSKWPSVDASVYVIVVDFHGNERYTKVISDLDRADWLAPFDKLAEAKTDLSVRTKRPSRELVNERPDLLEVGDPLWFGSVVDADRNVVVGVSGGPEQIDELIAELVLGLLLGPAATDRRNQVFSRGPGRFFVE